MDKRKSPSKRPTKASVDVLDLALKSAHMVTWKHDLKADQIQIMRYGKETDTGFLLGSKIKSAQLLDSVHPDDRKLFLNTIATAINTGEPFEIEYRQCPEGDKMLWVRAYGQVYYDAAGQSAGIIGVSQNITDRKLQEALAQEPARRIVALLDATPVVFAAIDRNGCLSYINRYGEEVFGVVSANVLGRPIHEALPGFLDTQFSREYERIVAHGVVAQYTAFYAPLNAWFEVVACPTEDGVGVYLRNVTDTIRTAVERKEARLRQMRFYSDVLNSVTDGKLHLCTDAGELPVAYEPLTSWESLSLSDGHSRLREHVADICKAHGFSDDRTQDLLTAVGEAAMNAIVHAGAGRARVRAEGDTVQVWIEDSGKGIDMASLPQAALKRGYTTAGSFGHGMKIMLVTADRIYLLTGNTGTTVVVEQDRLIPGSSVFPPPPLDLDVVQVA